MKQQLRRQFEQEKRVSVLDFTDKVDQYMDACDVLLTKPGGLTSTEAAVKNIPIIHTAPIPGCETVNAQFFSQRGLSVCRTVSREIAEAAERLANDSPLREDVYKRQPERHSG